MSTAIKPQSVPQPIVATLKRMTLQSITKGVLKVPDRLLLYGIEGIGKSSFAAAFPAPIFIAPERDGTAKIETSRFPTPETWEDIIAALDTLATDEHQYKTVVIDTLDSAESMLWEFLFKRDKKKDLEEYGYGGGYRAALTEWRVFLNAIERLRRVKRMSAVLIAHSLVKTFKNPEGPDYDRYEMKMYDKASGMIRDWCDAVLFATYETTISKDKTTKRSKGVATGARVLHTEWSPAWNAKNRDSLPAVVPLDYEDFAAALLSGQTREPSAMRTEIETMLAQFTDDVFKTKVREAVAKAGDDAIALAKKVNKLSAMLLEKEKGQ